MKVDFAARARSYGHFFQNIQPGNVDGIRELVTDDVRFKDPFNDVRGQDRLCRLLAKMFEDASEISFEMREQAGTGPVHFLRWGFTCHPHSRFVKERWQIDGVTMVHFAEDGRVQEHIDYWDAAEQVYGRLPVLGPLLRLASSSLALKD